MIYFFFILFIFHLCTIYLRVQRNFKGFQIFTMHNIIKWISAGSKDTIPWANKSYVISHIQFINIHICYSYYCWGKCNPWVVWGRNNCRPTSSEFDHLYIKIGNLENKKLHHFNWHFGVIALSITFWIFFSFISFGTIILLFWFLIFKLLSIIKPYDYIDYKK
jgi:hypothetical protein